MKSLISICLLIPLFLGACSNGPQIANDSMKPDEVAPLAQARPAVDATYYMGGFTVTITSWDTVNREYQKVCRINCDKSVKGFVNYTTHEVWSIASIPTVMHEVRHIVEGDFHD